MKMGNHKVFILVYYLDGKEWLWCMALVMLFSCQTTIPEDVATAWKDTPEKVDFNFHIRPILADRCYPCHGPDAERREADFRLDLEDEAFAPLSSGGYALVKGSLSRSKVWHRIISEDPDQQMPPPGSHLSLSAEEKALLARWIEEGADWKDHWAFIPLQQPAVPSDTMDWSASPIDRFLLQRMREDGLTPSDPASAEVLFRRVTMDLTGLPPTIEEMDQWLADTSEEAYIRWVDHCLQTDAHAERLALDWLDVARYGDTQGLHVDADRHYWPWRDWLIEAFRDNIPYDTLILWQMAGDLLPEANQREILATAFHRLHPMSSEGGIPNEEFRHKYVQDRTNTTATAFLGLTMECASCHDHKFDPVSQEEYYSMSAFFNNMDELGLVNEANVDDPARPGTKHASGPVLLLPDSLQSRRLNVLKAELDSLYVVRVLGREELASTRDFIESIKSEKVEPPSPVARFGFEAIRPHPVEDNVVHRIQGNQPIDQMVDGNPNALACGHPTVVSGVVGNALHSEEETDLVFLKGVGVFELHEPYTAGAWVKTDSEGQNQSIMGTGGAMGNGWRGWDFFLDSSNHLALRLVSMLPHNFLDVRTDESIGTGTWHQVFFTYDGTGRAEGISLYLDGRRMKMQVRADRLTGTIKRRWRKRPYWPDRPVMVFRSGRYHTGENGVYKGAIDQLRFYNQELSPLHIAALFEEDRGEASIKQAEDLREANLRHTWYEDEDLQMIDRQLRDLLRERTDTLKVIPDIMVMKDRKQVRPTYVLDRGQYNLPTTPVEPGIPAVLGGFPDTLPANRLGFAQWMISPQNPLTARVLVNRYWQMLFGSGLVTTPHDFGVQGSLPSHPALLDWLAFEFMDSGWDLRRLLRSMVLSKAYRQTSYVSDGLYAKDPSNRLWARASSYRWPAELIRDQALAASGLLVQKVGGPSVMPYQPDGIWDFGSLVSGNYIEGKGDDLYRRSMYTYIRRTSPHPAMVTFDAPDRLVCTAQRERTNTPLQALVLLNDPQYVEAARVLAVAMQKQGGEELEDQLTFAWRRVCGRFPDRYEMTILKELYYHELDRFKGNPTRAKQLLSTGQFPFDSSVELQKTAALTMVNNAIMNFDEAYMKR